MSKKIRYSLIVFGFILFLVIAPSLVVYVSGYSYDSKTKKFIKTSIIAIRAEPLNAEVFLNNTLVKKSVEDIRFVLPGEYNLILKKSGYFPWQKNIKTYAGEVFWVNSPNTKVYLLKQDLNPKTFANKVLNFTLSRENLYYLSQKLLTIENLIKPQKIEYPLPETFTEVKVSPNENLLLLKQEKSGTKTGSIFVFNIKENKLINLNVTDDAFEGCKFYEADTLLCTQNRQLFEISLLDGSQNLVRQNVHFFTTLGFGIYWLEKTSTNSTLWFSEKLLSKPNKLLDIKTEFDEGKIFVGSKKNLFLLLDQTLYSVEEMLKKQGDKILSTNFDLTNSSLIFTDGFELNFFSSTGLEKTMVTRSYATMSQLFLAEKIGYAFFNKQNNITALELDTRPTQNEFLLYKGKNIQKYILDFELKTIYLLDFGELKSLKLQD